MLTPMQTLAVRYLASGLSLTDTAGKMRMKVSELRGWTRLPAFQSSLHSAMADHEALVSAQLMDGEARAAKVLAEGLDATDKNGNPNWRVRMEAALSLLDRQGRRGKAVERTIQATVTDGSVEHALREALKDPSVRAWIKKERPNLIEEAEIVSAPLLEAGEA